MTSLNKSDTTNRSGEKGEAPPRRVRYLQKGGYWYYTTREGVDIGPFDSREDAEVGVGEFIEFIHASEPKVSDVLKQYRAA
ncbi:hypothetical protein CJA_3549 [Cellvibrio japonicus Ueda107]|uniref:DUF6316 domain-containing protein n=2 Tax=Cellvibrio japonicus TaxID=155077 RepID=B3PGV4_CELJU|nr:hypothetical protein CJA_3549 [Cellvibrio japonicus Ueda107]QEI14323.1 hypothetical protein FY117_17125 [Cellvibrio japonicus]QEI17900.1 hypothetical protein FY116_17130 [Cellvibrio japonicus]QEI21476.1 hypothetical protein FY115_17125 [Cellvibrio japonicus]